MLASILQIKTFDEYNRMHTVSCTLVLESGQYFGHCEPVANQEHKIYKLHFVFF